MKGEIQLEHTIDTGHRIVGHKGKCARLHGHTYRFLVTVRGVIRDPGFVIDFGDIKDLLNQWDHKLILWEEDPIFNSLADGQFQERIGITYVPFNPTAENMADYMARKVLIGDVGLDYCRIQLWETPKSCAVAEISRGA